nr:putative ribonuclease H-like domain-containing protein [Tanacetum cinerariifolium]
MIKTQFNKTVKKVRCDNDGEFTSNRMLSFYIEHGLFLETTCPHTPQQNGVVERKHCHLLETVRALKFEAKLSSKFWGECIMTAAHIINRLPSKTIRNKAPYEIIYDQKPNYEFLKVFGCLAYYRSTEMRGDKFEERGRPGVFLGYQLGKKGYKVYDVKYGKIVVSRDVRFFENIFPYDNNTSHEEDDEPKILKLPSWYYDNHVGKTTGLKDSGMMVSRPSAFTYKPPDQTSPIQLMC